MRFIRNQLFSLLVWTAIIAIIIPGCTTTIKTPGCIKPGMEDLRIRWGIFIKANGEVLGYEVDSRAGISAISRSGNTSSEIKKEMNYADPGKFCKVVSMVRNEIIKMQALNAPGDTSKFIELINPGSNMTFRAIWNPQFVTIANKGFSEAYDSLNALIKEK